MSDSDILLDETVRQVRWHPADISLRLFANFRVNNN